MRYPPQSLKSEELLASQSVLWIRLHDTREPLATDPRDRVFALHSLLGSARSEMSHFFDYTRPPEHCFVRVAEFFLFVLGFKILTGTRHPHNGNMPSWIPDWSQNLSVNEAFFDCDDSEALLRQNSRGDQLFDEEMLPIQRSVSWASGRTHPELLVTGCQYAQIVEANHVFSFKNMEDAEEKTERLLGCGRLLAGNLGRSQYIPNEASHASHRYKRHLDSNTIPGKRA